MNNDLERDSLATHVITNYLNAGFQGKFAQLNILSQLGHPSFDSAHASETRMTLDRVAFWTDELWKGQPIFAASWNTAQTFESQNALQLLDKLKLDIFALVKDLLRAFSDRKSFDSAKELPGLVATFGRFSYGREHYVRGLLEFATHFKREEDIKRYSSLLPPAQEDIRLTHSFLGILREPGKNQDQAAAIVRVIVERTFPLISVFRTHLHDINQLAATYRGGFSFEKADFSPEEAKLWQETKLSPVQAGYWRANGFNPSDTIGWVESGINSPTLAGMWKLFSFDFTQAPAWLKQNVPPAVARTWNAAGFGPSETREFLERGIFDPQKAREEKGPANQ